MAAVGLVVRMRSSTSPRANFEKETLEALRGRIDALPAGAATLTVSKDPSDTRSPFPYFEVSPANQRSARIRGTVSDGEGVYVTVGCASSREIWIAGGSLVRGVSCQEEFLFLCDAVFRSSFHEDVVYDKSGATLSSRLVLRVAGRNVLLSSGGRLRCCLRRGRRERIDYEPYC